jgi:hypothetical protein
VRHAATKAREKDCPALLGGDGGLAKLRNVYNHAGSSATFDGRFFLPCHEIAV